MASSEKIDTTTHWFHRNLLKFTAIQEFNCEATCKGPLAQKVINDVKMARFDLLNSIYELHSERAEVMTKYEHYVSLILGICNPSDSFPGSSSKTTANSTNNLEDQSAIASLDPHASTEQTPQQRGDSGVSRTKSKSKQEINIKVSPRYYFGFRWTDSLSINKKNPQSLDRVDSYFDLICVTILVAIYLSKLANRLASTESSTMEDAKEIHSCLKLAGSLFDYTKENLISELKDSVFLEHQSWSDLDPRILDSYKIQCQAELLEVTVARAIKLEHKPHLVASLANDCQRLFKGAQEKLESVEESANEKVEKWRHYMTLKQQIYSAIATAYYGWAIKGEDKKSGYATGYLAAAVDTLKVAQTKSAKHYNKTAGAGSDCKPNEHPFFFKVREDIISMHKEADRDRQMVYGMPLPSEGSLPDPEYKNDVSKLYSLEQYKLPEKSSAWVKDAYDQFYLSKEIKNDFGSSLMASLTLKSKPTTDVEEVTKKFQNDKSKFNEAIKVYKEKDIKIKSNLDCSIM